MENPNASLAGSVGFYNGLVPGAGESVTALSFGQVKLGLEGTVTHGDLLLCAPTCSAMFCFYFLLRLFWITQKSALQERACQLPKWDRHRVLATPQQLWEICCRGVGDSEPLPQGAPVTKFYLCSLYRGRFLGNGVFSHLGSIPGGLHAASLRQAVVQDLTSGL